MAFPQLTREQMFERCDLAGVARVLWVGRESPDSPNLVKLAFVRVLKGAVSEAEGCAYVRLHGSAVPRSDAELVSWSDWWDYPVGALVETHLDYNGPDDVYQTTWPGAVREIGADLKEVA